MYLDLWTRYLTDQLAQHYFEVLILVGITILITLGAKRLIKYQANSLVNRLDSGQIRLAEGKLQVKKIYDQGLAIEMVVVAPLIEELLFRTPLLFTESLTVWSAFLIIVSTAIFSGLHYFYQVYDKVAPLEKEFYGGSGGTRKKKERLMSVLFVTILGTLCGVVTVYFQHVWIAALIHATWNSSALLGALYWRPNTIKFKG